MSDKPTKLGRCPTCKRLMKRSLDANARYWALLHCISEAIQPNGSTFSPETWHVWARSKFLGRDSYKLPNGVSVDIPRSTADLDTAEFNDYMTELESWAGDHGAFLADRMMA